MKTWCALQGRGRRACTFPVPAWGPCPATSRRPAHSARLEIPRLHAPTRPGPRVQRGARGAARGPRHARTASSGRVSRRQTGSAPLAPAAAAAEVVSPVPRRHSPLPCAPEPGGSGSLRGSGSGGPPDQRPAPQGPGVRAPGADEGAPRGRPGSGRRPALSAAAGYSAAAAACARRRARLPARGRLRPADVPASASGRRGRGRGRGGSAADALDPGF